MGKRKYKKKTMWSKEGEEIFIKLWQQKHVLLRTERKNSHIIQEMVEELKTSGIHVTPADIKNKISNLTMKYKKEKAKITADGSPSDWPSYEEVNKILGSAKNINMEERIVHESIMDDCIKYEDIFVSELDACYGERSCSSPALSSPAMTSYAASPSPGTSPSPTSAAKEKNYFQMQILKYLEGADTSIQNLVVEMHESNKIERAKAVQIEKYVSCMADLTKSMTDFLKRE